MIINWNKDSRPNVNLGIAFNLFKNNYPYIEDISPIKQGVLNQCFELKTLKDKLFGKIINQQKPKDHLLAEVKFAQILKKEKIPAQGIIFNLKGEIYTETPYGTLMCYEFILGNCFKYTDKKIISGAQTQARLHQLDLSSLEKMLDPSDLTEEIPLLINNLKNVLESGINPERILSNTVLKLNNYSQFKIQSKTKPIHADYHPGNLLFSDSGEIAGVLDFDYLQMGKKIYDLGASLTYFFRAPPKDQFEPERAKIVFDKYLSAYQKIRIIQENEIDAIPRMMILRLADNLARDLKGKSSNHILADSNIRNLQMLDWAFSL